MAVSVGFKIPITTGDVSFLTEEIYNGRSAVTGLSTRLNLIRWRKPAGTTLIKIGEGAEEQKSSNVTLGELVCMTKEEATRHDKEILRGEKKLEDLYDQDTIDKIERLLKEAGEYARYR